MNRQDFAKLVGADEQQLDYNPIALLLRDGYGVAGYYNSTLNSEMNDTAVLLNARMVQLEGESSHSTRPAIHNFNDFIEEIVANVSNENGQPGDTLDEYGKSVPLMAIPLDAIFVVYPVCHISELLRRASAEDKPKDEDSDESEKRLPTFLDLDRSEIIRLLKTKIW